MITDKTIMDVIAKQTTKNQMMGTPNKWVSVSEIVNGMYIWFGLVIMPSSCRYRCNSLFAKQCINSTKKGGRLYFSLT